MTDLMTQLANEQETALLVQMQIEEEMLKELTDEKVDEINRELAEIAEEEQIERNNEYAAAFIHNQAALAG